MERDEFKSLPPSFFEEDRTAPEPKWLLVCGAICIAVSGLIALLLLAGL